MWSVIAFLKIAVSRWLFKEECHSVWLHWRSCQDYKAELKAKTHHSPVRPEFEWGHWRKCALSLYKRPCSLEMKFSRDGRTWQTLFPLPGFLSLFFSHSADPSLAGLWQQSRASYSSTWIYDSDGEQRGSAKGALRRAECVKQRVVFKNIFDRYTYMWADMCLPVCYLRSIQEES